MPKHSADSEISPELIAQANALRGQVHRRPASSPPHAVEGLHLLPGEDPRAFQALLHTLLMDHKPASITEELLVREMAQSWWLLDRARRLQTECLAEPELDASLFGIYLRYAAGHERAFYKALNTLCKIRKERSARKPAPSAESAEPPFVPPEQPVAEEPACRHEPHARTGSARPAHSARKHTTSSETARPRKTDSQTEDSELDWSGLDWIDS